MSTPTNPFRVAELVRGAYFTDRADEVRTVLRAMRERGRLLVHGPRRMGKSTLIDVAAAKLGGEGGIVVAVDLATITSLVEAAERLLAAVSREERWTDRLMSWMTSLAPVVTLGADAAGRPRLSVGVEARPRRVESERELLGRVLDRIDEAAAEHEEPVVVLLDEFQRLSELGGEAAEWLLRNRIQAHRHTGYVCAGSKESLLREMLRPQRAFYKFFESLHVGPIDPDHLGTWIDDRFRSSGVDAPGVGAVVIDGAGPRTQDILLLARALWFRSALAGRATSVDVEAALRDVVASEDASLRRTWEDLSPGQQKVLGALAAGAEQLHSTETRERFGLGASSSVASAVEALTDRAILVREDGEVRFDSPFFREWLRGEVPR